VQLSACLIVIGERKIDSEFEPHQRLPLLQVEQETKLLSCIAKYWLVPGTDSSVIFIIRTLLVSHLNYYGDYKNSVSSIYIM